MHIKIDPIQPFNDRPITIRCTRTGIIFPRMNLRPLYQRKGHAMPVACAVAKQTSASDDGNHWFSHGRSQITCETEVSFLDFVSQSTGDGCQKVRPKGAAGRDSVRRSDLQGFNQVISNTGFESPCSTKGESYRFSPLDTPSALCPPQEAGFTLNERYLISASLFVS